MIRKVKEKGCYVLIAICLFEWWYWFEKEKAKEEKEKALEMKRKIQKKKAKIWKKKPKRGKSEKSDEKVEEKEWKALGIMCLPSYVEECTYMKLWCGVCLHAMKVDVLVSRNVLHKFKYLELLTQIYILPLTLAPLQPSKTFWFMLFSFQVWEHA